MALATAIVEDEAALEPLRAGWDRLAVEADAPFSAPGWMLPWWRNAAPDGAGLRMVAVSDGDDLLGVAPFWAAKQGSSRSDYEALSAWLAPPAGPLAAAGREREAAAAMIEALLGAAPRPAAIRFWSGGDGATVGTHLAAAAAERRCWVHTAAPQPVPIVSFEGNDFDAWLSTRSSKFRQEVRRRRRRLDDADARFRQVEADDSAPALDAFVELHGARWQDRGGSDALIPGLREMLAEAATELIPSGRLRIFTLEAEGKPFAVSILVAAGTEVSGWSSGFDRDWHRYSPSIQLALFAIADAIGRGEERLCLGPGEAGYKRRIADTRQEIEMTTLVPRDTAYPLNRLRLAPYQARAFLGSRLSPEVKSRVSRLLPGASR